MLLDVLAKVVAILLATAAVWGLGRGLDFLFSAAQAHFGRGYNVSGQWLATYSKGGVDRRETATVRQVFHRVWGTIENREIGEGQDSREYAVRGTLSANVLVATYELKTRGKQIDCGAFTMVLGPEGGMSGFYSWMDSDTGSPQCGTYVWRRKGGSH